MKKFEFDPIDNTPLKPKGQRAVRPKDAATLILVRHVNAKPQVLMGQRNKGHVFMPNKFVFPGGRTSTGDSYIRPLTSLRPEVENKLRLQTNRKNVESLALAAVRETFEETGLLVGQKANGVVADRKLNRPRLTRSPQWKAFLEHGVAPSLRDFQFIARAITPSYIHRRFDARFFMANADLIQNDENDFDRSDGELLQLEWLYLEDAINLDLPIVTRTVLDLIEQHLKNATTDINPLFLRYMNGKARSEYL